MILSATQVQEKLGIGKSTLKKLVIAGDLKPVNLRRDGAKKYYMKFDSRDVNAFTKTSNTVVSRVRTMRARKTISAMSSSVIASATQSLGSGLFTRIDRLEEKIDRLLAIWS